MKTWSLVGYHADRAAEQYVLTQSSQGIVVHMSTHFLSIRIQKLRDFGMCFPNRAVFNVRRMACVR